MDNFQPDYKNIINAAKRLPHQRIPLYEHIIDTSIMEKILNNKFAYLYDGNIKDRRQYFREYNRFFKKMGYDTVSFECLITSVMPNGGALYHHNSPAIKDRRDFESYPWDELPDYFFNKYADDFKMLGEEMPDGMLASGGPGNGIFECIQDIVGLTNICMISNDDPELYRELFFKMGEVFFKIWERFLERFAQLCAVCRFGDDLGYKSSTILNPKDISSLIIPQYKKIIDLIHSYGKPFIFHSCGNIFSVMDDLIDNAKIDVKHSNEDEIAPFNRWLELYGNRIALFGGADMSYICNASESDIKSYVEDLMNYSSQYYGFAFGTGNSVPDYIPVENYIAMVEEARMFRRKI